MSKTIAKITCYALVIVLLVAVVGIIYKYTNGFNEDFKTFYIECDGRQILTTESKMTLKQGESYRFDVKYTFDTENSEPKDYKVKIIPNMTRDFDYTVDGERYLFSKVGDLSAVFELVKSDTFFELYLSDGLTFSEVLKNAQGGKNISVPADALTNNPYPFKLQVSSYNEKVTYNIDFTFGDIGSTGSGQSGEGNKDTPSTPTETTYEISYFFEGPLSPIADVSLTADKTAKSGDTVTFKVNIGDTNYSVTGVRAWQLMTSTTVIVKDNGNNSYSFTMPSAKVTVRIYIEYHDPQGKITYPIGYETLGWADMEVVNFSCPDQAAAGETVTFTAKIKPEYADEYYISRIAVILGSSEEYIGTLQSSNGTYSFVMPDSDTMEDEADGYIYLLFYIIPIDM